MAVTLLLVGRDGNGKSSTGNSILGYESFTPRPSSKSGNVEVLSGSAVIDGKEIQVVDGPGIGETNINDPGDVNVTLQSVERAIDLCSTGFTALVVIFNYCSRFTQQEKDTVFLIRSIFGECVFKDYGIIVMTHGDTFNFESMTFETWCSRQTGDINNLLLECKNRCVLFNNRAKDEWFLRTQRDLLLTSVQQIQARISPYTRSDYLKAENGRKRITIESKKAALEVETKEVLDKITQSLGRVDVRGRPELAIEKISELQRTIDNHKRRLQTEAENTELMNGLLVQVKVMESNLETKATLAKLELRKREQIAYQSVRENVPLNRDLEGQRRNDSCWLVCLSCLSCSNCVIYFLQCVGHMGRRIFS